MLKEDKCITAVILTYGGRTYIYDVIKHLVKQQSIKDIVVVSNGQVFLPPSEIEIPCHVINNERNEGSATGYAAGIEKAKELDNQFVWLLDDDNLPEDDALEILLDIWEKNRYSNDEKPVALQCYRTSQFAYRNIFGKKELQLLPLRNSFMFFHVRNILKIILNKFKSKKYSIAHHQQLYKSDAAFYGGLFLETKTLHLIPPPNSIYFMYVDDLAFTAGIRKLGGTIFVIVDSVINDLDFSIQLEKKNRLLYHPILDFFNQYEGFTIFARMSVTIQKPN